MKGQRWDRFEGLAFVGICWLVTRGLILAVMVVSAKQGGSGINWDTFGSYDGGWYAHIATRGYEFTNDGAQHTTAFFPVFPLIAGLLMRATSARYSAVGMIVSNVAFFCALLVMYDWVRRKSGLPAARWTTVTLCLLPTSLFGAIAYSEGLFMLLTAAALRAFDRGNYAAAAIWAALASGTRIFGALLLPAFALDAYLRKRGRPAYLAAVAALAGPVAFSLYCYLAFGDPLAFLHAQRGWRSAFGFSFPDWEYIFAVGITWQWYYQLAILAVGTWWYRRAKPGLFHWLAGFLLAVAEINLWGNERMVFILVGLGGVLLIRYRKRIPPAATAYALAGLGVIFFSGIPSSSLERYAYSLVPISWALGLLWARFPAFGIATLAITSIDLVDIAARFARATFVG